MRWPTSSGNKPKSRSFAEQLIDSRGFISRLNSPGELDFSPDVNYGSSDMFSDVVTMRGIL